MQFSAPNPVCSELHFSALRHGVTVLWAEFWFVIVRWALAGSIGIVHLLICTNLDSYNTFFAHNVFYAACSTVEESPFYRQDIFCKVQNQDVLEFGPFLCAKQQVSLSSVSENQSIFLNPNIFSIYGQSYLIMRFPPLMGDARERPLNNELHWWLVTPPIFVRC